MLVLWVLGCGESHKATGLQVQGSGVAWRWPSNGRAYEVNTRELVSRALAKPLNPKSCLTALRRTD